MERITRKLRSLLLPFLLALSTTQATIPYQKRTWPDRWYPGQIGFPSYAAFADIMSSLRGGLISPLDKEFANASMMVNTRVLTSPGAHFFPADAKDIQKIVSFSHEHNIHLCVRSSGHSYIGRSTHGGALVVNMYGMREMKVDLNSDRNPAGEITVQSGASWIEVYEKVDTIDGPGPNGGPNVGRVIVGGSAHTVCMGGYTLGGGHSPIGRKHGLAVDNLLEVTMVTADGSLMTLTADKTEIEFMNGTTKDSSDTSLFWAIRGGGGGTFGIVVDFTFALHYAPERFQNILLTYPMFNLIGGGRSDETSVKRALREVSKLSEDWGGYVIFSSELIPSTTYKGSMLLFLNHHGSDADDSYSEIDDLLSETTSIYTVNKAYDTFLEYEVNAKDPLYFSTYIANTFINASTMENSGHFDAFVDFIYDDVVGAGASCTLTMIGGDVMESNARPATPIHPGFRKGKFSASCGVGWAYDPSKDEENVEKALDIADDLYGFGYGSYFNEPAEDMADWKTRFWQDEDTYDKLLSIKKDYDPDNYFWCHNCVGSDLGTKYSNQAANLRTNYVITAVVSWLTFLTLRRLTVG